MVARACIYYPKRKTGSGGLGSSEGGGRVLMFGRSKTKETAKGRKQTKSESIKERRGQAKAVTEMHKK